MTEARWLVCKDPFPMLEHVQGEASERKLRLFACACCRRIWQLLDSDVLRRTLEDSERYADGQLDERDRESAFDYAMMTYCQDWYDVPEAIIGSISRDHDFIPTCIARSAAQAAACDELRLGYEGENPSIFRAEQKWQSRIVRCVFGNPFRPSAFDMSLLTPAIVSLSRRMYEDRDFDGMPILGDALEEAGCDNSDMLSHCRSGTEHVRGCWVVDAVLGKS